jgi:hypothetical protein
LLSPQLVHLLADSELAVVVGPAADRGRRDLVAKVVLRKNEGGISQTDDRVRPLCERTALACKASIWLRSSFCSAWNRFTSASRTPEGQAVRPPSSYAFLSGRPVEPSSCGRWQCQLAAVHGRLCASLAQVVHAPWA